MRAIAVNLDSGERNHPVNNCSWRPNKRYFSHFLSDTHQSFTCIDRDFSCFQMLAPAVRNAPLFIPCTLALPLLAYASRQNQV